MDKPIRKAVRCYLTKDGKVVVIKYKQGNKKAGYYDIPGGKIEEGELPEQAVIREMKEETGLNVKNLKHKGNMLIEYPNRKYDMDIFITDEYEGQAQETEENYSEWIEINELLQKEKVLACIVALDKFFIKSLIEDKYNISMYFKVDEEENILNMKYEKIEN